MKIGELKAEMDKRFEQVDERFVELTKQIAVQGEDFRQFVVAEGESTRRHFDMVADQMQSERNLALDQSMAATEQVGHLTASNTAAHAELEKRLDDHERRIASIEEP